MNIFIMEKLHGFLQGLAGNNFVILVIIAIAADTILGLLRAIKAREFNSSFGIDGAIRKIAMIISVIFLALVDALVGFNVLPFLPDGALDALAGIGLTRLAICEFFCILYILYEAISILKNLTLCGAPMPAKAREKLQEWLTTMTGEMNNTGTEEKENENTFNCGSRSR